MRATLCACTALTLADLTGLPQAQADEALLSAKCGICHNGSGGGGEWGRISEQRKTPEGWLMTIVRMRTMGRVELSAHEQAKLVAYLAETQGLAPAETEGWRYALEKDPAAIEQLEEPLASMCGRCHTGARYALQRRTPEEWDVHMDFHVGQYPTIEYQAMGRDREWFEIAKNEIAPMLADAFPLESEAWTTWQGADKPDVSGEWVVLTSLPEQGQAYGRLTVTGEASPYEISGEMRFADGTAAPVKGQMNLYTGYEWRANLDIGGIAYRQVLAVAEDGGAIEGRQFMSEADSLGGPLTGAHADGDPALLGTVPENAAPGEVTIQVVGTGLTDLSAEGGELGDSETNPYGLVASLSSIDESTVRLAAGNSDTVFTFYQTVDHLEVEPGFTIARVGGGSDVGPDRVPAHFQAIGFWNGPDGKPGTADDIRIGEIPATWSVHEYDEIAESLDDAAFAGTIGADGIFMPAVAGPNPARPFSTNNAGNLTITASALGASADAQLIVTVQRFIDPPIR